MKRFILIAVLFFIVVAMYGYHLGRLESYALLRANSSAADFLPTIQFGVSFWDQLVFWSGPIFALLLILPAINFIGEIYLRDQMQKTPLEFRMMTQLKEWLRDLARRDQQESGGKDKANPA